MDGAGGGGLVVVPARRAPPSAGGQPGLDLRVFASPRALQARGICLAEPVLNASTHTHARTHTNSSHFCGFRLTRRLASPLQVVLIRCGNDGREDDDGVGVGAATLAVGAAYPDRSVPPLARWPKYVHQEFVDKLPHPSSQGLAGARACAPRCAEPSSRGCGGR